MFAVSANIPLMPHSLGSKIKELRVQADITLRELARRLEVAPSHLSDIEHDRRHPSEDKLKKLADLLRVPFEQLKDLDPRVGDLKDWMRGQPAVARLLRKIQQNDHPEELIQNLLKASERSPKETKEK